MRNNFRKILALLLVLTMTFGLAPAVFAEGEATEVEGTDGDFNYTIVTPESGDKYAVLTAYTGDEEEVTVPSSFEGVALKVIGHEAFYAAAVTSVTLPDGIETIDSRAFCNCVYLSSIILPDTVTEIGSYAFNGCYSEIKGTDPVSGLITTVGETGLRSIHLPESLEVIGDFAFFGCKLFEGNATIVSNVEGADDVSALLLPVSVRDIGADAFSQCRSLINVIIPEGVTDIKNGTFTDCSALEKVEIPSTVTHIGPAFNGAFTDHGRLSEYEPTLIINAPHCIIEDSPNMDRHVVVKGAEHSCVQAYIDGLNAALEDNFYKDYSDFVGIEQELDYFIFEAIEIPGHTFVGTVTEPTCTKRGFTTYVCEQCQAAGYYDDAELSELYIPHICDYVLPLGHLYGEWVVDGLPTCETSGAKHRTCNRETWEGTCTYTSRVTLAPLGHHWENHMTATCTQRGQSWKECVLCHAKRDVQAHAAQGHVVNYEEPTVVITECVLCEGEGTEAVDGHYVYTCLVCGETWDAVKPAHPDENNDFFCDVCGIEIGTSDQSPEGNCSCDCHVQVGFFAWFYKIKLFFWKLFGVNRICDCGVMHY